jgi:hypothetical protein
MKTLLDFYFKECRIQIVLYTALAFGIILEKEERKIALCFLSLVISLQLAPKTYHNDFRENGY